MKKKLEKFWHDSDMLFDPLIQQLIQKFGAEGFGVYNALLGYIYQNPEPDRKIKFNFEEYSKNLNIKITALKGIISYIEQINLLNQNWDGNRIQKELSKQIKQRVSRMTSYKLHVSTYNVPTDNAKNRLLTENEQSMNLGKSLENILVYSVNLNCNTTILQNIFSDDLDSYNSLNTNDLADYYKRLLQALSNCRITLLQNDANLFTLKDYDVYLIFRLSYKVSFINNISLFLLLIKSIFLFLNKSAENFDKIVEFSDLALKFCSKLPERYTRNLTMKSFFNWYSDYSKLRQIDKYSQKEIEDVILFARNHNLTKDWFFSISKLRKKTKADENLTYFQYFQLLKEQNNDNIKRNRPGFKQVSNWQNENLQTF